MMDRKRLCCQTDSPEKNKATETDPLVKHETSTTRFKLEVQTRTAEVDTDLLASVTTDSPDNQDRVPVSKRAFSVSVCASTRGLFQKAGFQNWDY